MRELTPTEVQLVERLLAAADRPPARLERFLADVFFTNPPGRALILQPAERFGYFYLTPAVYDDEAARGEELRRLIELMMLLVHLRSHGYLVVNGASPAQARQMRYVSATFQNPTPSTAHIVLNQRGDYTFQPETIRDKDDTVIYRGIRLEGDLYDLVAENSSGLLYVSPAIARLLPPPPPPVEEPRPTPRPHAFGRYGAWVVVTFVLTLLVPQNAGVSDGIVSGRPTSTGQVGLPPRSAVVPASASAVASAAPSTVVAQPASTAATDDLEHHGVDLSRWNANMLQPALDAGHLDFVFVRATYGRSTDLDFERSWRALQDRGVIRGAYHFYLVHDDPIAQADYYLSVVGEREPLEIAPAVDFEELSFPPRATPPDVATVQNGLLGALSRIEARTGRVPIIYTDTSVGNRYLDDPRFARYPLWIADWTSRSAPTVPAIWKEVGYRFWQRSSQYSMPVPGASPVDFDLFKGRREEIYR